MKNMQIMEEITTYVLLEDIAEMTFAVLSHQVGDFVFFKKKKSKTKAHPNLLTPP